MRSSLSAVFGTLATVSVAFLIGACGGSQTDQPDAQDKQASRSVKQASSPYAQVVQQLYVAYFGRPADPAGLTNFENALAAAHAPTDAGSLAADYASDKAVQTLIDSFGTSKESQTLYGSGSTQDFVTAVFNNVLGRAPLASGLSYWSNAIDSGSLSKGDAALAIMAGALANTTAQGKTDTQLINNRLAVAANFTAQVDSAGATASYSGAAAAASARSMLAGVDSTTNIDGYASTIDSTITGILQSTPGISLVAGNTTPLIPLNTPTGLVSDSSGNFYVLDEAADVLGKIAPDGTYTILAGSSGASGSADGTGAAARFYYPRGLAIDGKGNLYVADTGNSTIRKVTPAGVVTTVAGQPSNNSGFVDGPGQTAKFFNPQGVAVDGNGNIYVADTTNQVIRKITSGGVVSTLAGQSGKCGYADGVGNTALFCTPTSLVADGAGNVYVADLNNRAIREVAPNGTVSTLAGDNQFKEQVDGTGSAAHFCTPVGLTLDGSGNLLISDQGCTDKPTVRKLTMAGVVTTVAGKNAAAFVTQTPRMATFGGLEGLATDANGNVFVADYSFRSIWKISSSGIVTTYTGQSGASGSVDGAGPAAYFYGPTGIVADSSGNVFVSDWHNGSIRKITPLGEVTTLAGTDGELGGPYGLTIDSGGNMYSMGNSSAQIALISASGTVSTLNLASGSPYLGGATDIARDKAGNLYLCLSYANVILKVTPDGVVSTLAGLSGQSGSVDGAGSAARFSSPSGLAVDNAGNLYVADTYNETIRRIDLGGNVTTVAGSAGSAGFADGAGAAARFHYPEGLAFDAAGNLYIADHTNNAIRKMTSAGVVSTIAGSAAGSTTVLGALPGAIHRPLYLTIVGTNTLYVTSDSAVLRIRLP